MKTNSIFKFNARWLMAVVAILTIGVGQMWADKLIIDGDHASLTTTVTTSANNYSYTADNTNSYTITMYAVKYQPLGTASNNLSSGKVIMGTANSTYMYNSTALGNRITGFKVYHNAGASTKASISVCFSSSSITSLCGSPAYSATLSTADAVYDLSTYLASTDKYFYLKFTDEQSKSKSAQIQIEVTFETNLSVTYHANGATSGTVPTDATAYTSGNTVTVKANTGSLARTGCTFAGWNTAADGSGTNYAASGSATFTISANTTLYAKWTATVTWVVNGVTVQTDNIVVPAAGKSVTPPSAPNPASNCGDKFMGWTTTNIGAEGIDKANTSAISALGLFTAAPTVTGSTTYYAVFANYAE